MEKGTVENRELEIDLRALFHELIQKIGIIVLSTGIMAVAVLIVSMFFIKPEYQSSTKVYILNKEQANASVTYNDLQTATQLTNDYEELIKSRYVMDTVIADLKLDTTAEKLAETVSVTSTTGTRILEISVKNNDPYLAQNIADKVREVAGKQIVDIMNIDAVNLVDEANLPISPVSPDSKKNALIGGLIGFLLSCAVIVVMYIFNDSVRTPDDVENYLGLSVLGVIPFDDGKPQKNGRKR